MKLYELLQVFHQEEYRYQDEVANKPLPFIAIDTEMGGTIRLNDHEVFSTRLATYNEKFLNSKVRWVSIINGNLHIHVENYSTNEDWKKADKLKKEDSLPGMIVNEIREFIKSKTEPQDSEYDSSDLAYDDIDD